DALAIASAIPCASLRVVVGDRAAGNGQGTDADDRGAVIVNAAAQAVAPVAAGAPRAADGLVGVHGAAADGEGGADGIRDAAAASVGPVAAKELAADGLVVVDGAVADRGHR